jgi:AmmeMemoRadiSam system protein B
MTVRRAWAPHFYSGDCARAAERFLKGFSPPAEPGHIVAGIVPHAGWEYSGAVAAKVFESIRQQRTPATFVIFGAVHGWIGGHAVYARGAWQTPLGEVAVDEELASLILQRAGELALDDPAAHDGEHAIEVELPLVKYLFPKARIVPISVRPEQSAVRLGTLVGEILREWPSSTVIIGSTDLTHYGRVYGFTPAGFGEAARQWMRQNDDRILRLALGMHVDQIVAEASAHQNACGPGAMAATVAAAAVLGAGRGYLVQHTSSFEVVPEQEFRMAVGYAGILY